jgi:hypothetical protein
MPEQDDMHNTMMKVTARAMVLETLLLAVIANSSEKIKILKAFEHELENQSARTLFDSEMKDYPEKELPAVQDHILGQVAALCAAA